MIAPNGPLREFYTTVYAPLRLRGKSDSTKRQYLIQLNHFDRFLGRPSAFCDLNDETLEDFLGWLQEGGRAAPTVNKARTHLLALWRLAARKRYVDHEPDVQARREPQRIPKAWTLDQLDRLLATLPRLQGTIGGVPESLWWAALHSVLFFTGERIGAVLQLRWDDLDSESGWLTVPAEVRKMKTRDRTHRLPDETLEALRRIHFPDRELIFPFPYAAQMLYRRYKRILLMAGLPTDRKSMFHRIRKSTASHYKAAGGNPTDLLDHSNSRVTQAYIDPTIAPPAQAADRLPTLRKKLPGS